jgi:hypothetical protein
MLPFRSNNPLLNPDFGFAMVKSARFFEFEGYCPLHAMNEKKMNRRGMYRGRGCRRPGSVHEMAARKEHI